MRLDHAEHASRRWRIHELTPDFRLEDVWALPVTGGPDDFHRLVELVAANDPSRATSRPAQALWALRWRLGEALGWDEPGTVAPGGLLRDRLPPDLRAGPTGPDVALGPFRGAYLLGDEWAAEIVNRTVHGVLHLGWVADGSGGHRGQLAVLVKPKGLLGEAYLAAIRPFRYLVVYPALLRQLERAWQPA
jgi:hypothetical protein